MNDKNYEEIAVGQVLTVAEGVAAQQRIAALRGLKQWQWMGNYGGVCYPTLSRTRAGSWPAKLSSTSISTTA